MAAVAYCEEQEDAVDRGVESLCTLLTVLLIVVIAWGALRCAWLAKLILAPHERG